LIIAGFAIALFPLALWGDKRRKAIVDARISARKVARERHQVRVYPIKHKLWGIIAASVVMTLFALPRLVALFSLPLDRTSTVDLTADLLAVLTFTGYGSWKFRPAYRDLREVQIDSAGTTAVLRDGTAMPIDKVEGFSSLNGKVALSGKVIRMYGHRVGHTDLLERIVNDQSFSSRNEFNSFAEDIGEALLGAVGQSAT